MVMGKFLAKPGGGLPVQASDLTPEEISELMDGELDTERVEHACHALREAASMEAWIYYHVIGDTLRGCSGLAPRFAERFSARLGSEPTVLAPPPRRTAPAAIAWAVAASAAAVSVVGWVALQMMPPLPAALPGAVATVQQATSVRAADVRRPVENEYLLAHQEYSPTTAIQGVRPTLRAASAEQQDVRR
jgi:sigma-E factor negative regulatory protein RseA